MEVPVFDFVFFVSEICLFGVHPCCDFLRYNFFSYFRPVCGWLRSLDVFIVVPFISSSVLAIVAEADLRCGDVLSEKKLSSQIGSFH